MSVKQHIIRGLDRLLSPWLFARQRKSGAGVILLYHRISPDPDPAYQPLPPTLFEQHCQIIKSNFHVIPLSQFITRLRQGESLGGYAALTFDDGYKDFLEYAYPILSRYALPATHFLVTDSLQSGRPNWTPRMLRLLYYAQQHNCLDRLRVSDDKESAPAIKQRVMAMGIEARYEWLEACEKRMDMLPPEPPMLRADDLSQCDKELVEWGSHTVSHPQLARCSEKTVRHELETSRRLLVDMAGASIRYVSYPIGSYSPAVMQVAEQSNYECGFAVDGAEVTRQSHLYAIPRFDVGAKYSSEMRLEITGTSNFFRSIRNRMKKVSPS